MKEIMKTRAEKGGKNGVARELNIAGIREADVHIAAGLPLTWIRNQREEFRSYLMRNENADFVFNGKKYSVQIRQNPVLPNHSEYIQIFMRMHRHLLKKVKEINLWYQVQGLPDFQA